ncbi:MAG: PAS domain-containing protein [Phycisphaerales bacterium]|nr:PAS domain-containing protein [Hyphomonadaceae bacterium]
MGKSPTKRIKDQESVIRDPSAPPLVVGIGASAGGLEAFKTFFSLMPANSGMAFVLVQHLDPNRSSMLVELLSAATQMPVSVAADGAQVAANHVYVIPPDATLTMDEDILRITRPAPPRETRRPIDAFFVSLAEAQGDNAVCVVLSGGGSDGSVGLAAIKEHGGLTLAQAEFDSHAKLGMPSSAAATGRVDQVLTVEEMPERLITYQRHLASLRGRIGPDGAIAVAEENLDKICRIVRSVVGHDFSQYKEKTVTRRIQRRMQVLHLDSMEDYIDRLRKDPHEVRLLFQEFLISVTEFFRDPEAFAALEAQALPNIVDNKGADDQIRVWIAGCATGEEVYSIAILLKEKLSGRDGAPRVQIFATDIDEDAVAHARAGRYRLDQLEGVTPARREKWFVDENGLWCPTKAIRELCVFSVHSAIKDPPFSKLDLIVCRNVLIYLQPPAQDRLMGVFQYALRPGGYLFLGASESVTRQSRGFSTVDKKHRIFQRRDAPVPLPTLATHAPEKSAPDRAPARPAANGEDRLDIDARRVMERHFPAYVVVDARNDVVRFSGQVAKYLGPSPGAASLDLFNLLQRPLRPAARAALQKAMRGREAAVQKNIALEIDGASHVVDLIAEPVAGEGGFYVLAFLDRGPTPATVAPSQEGVHDLEQELALTRERLQASVDELEVNNEEMKSANEEYQSVNEELQSTNEELETSKEEMQSINEELQTVNAELSAKNDTLLRLNSDLKNFLDSTDVATLFLDTHLRVTNFTPAMTDLFHLRESDYHRPVTEIATRFEYGRLADDVARVLRTLSVIEHEVTTAAGRAFIMRIRPYRRLDNVIDGVVVTFVDVTDRKKLEAERALRSAMVVSSGDAIIGLNLNGTINSWNAGAETLYGYSSAEAIGKDVELIIPAARQSGELDVRAQISRGDTVQHYDTVGQRRDASSVDISITVSPVKNDAGAITGASLVVRDITERIRIRERQAMLLQELNHRVKNTLATVQSIASQTLIDEPDPKAFREAFQKRLGSMSRTHNMLSDGDWKGSPLRDLLLAEAAPYANGDANRVAIDGPDLKLTPSASLAMGMAFHELATNAAKYGAFSVPSGRVRVHWQVDNGDDERRLRLEWRESNGPPVTAPTRRGLGSRLIERGLAHHLNGEAKLRFDGAGVSFLLDAPLASIEAPA